MDYNQPVFSPLIELRNRTLRTICFIGLVFFMLFPFSSSTYEVVASPLQKLIPPESKMIATDVTSPFLTPLKLTWMLALFISIPFILYQVWRFVGGALHVDERRIILPVTILSVVLFYIGIGFSYFIVFPLVIDFFVSAAPVSVSIMTDINSYLSFSIKTFLAFGLAFEIPVGIVLLTGSGIVSICSLQKNRPYIVVACFTLAMFMTPPDIFSQLLLAIPMWGLFEFGLIFSKFICNNKLDFVNFIKS